jgi:hypothetical protein
MPILEFWRLWSLSCDTNVPDVVPTHTTRLNYVLKIGKFAAKSGHKAAVEKFSTEMGKPVSESTARARSSWTTAQAGGSRF